VQLIYSADRARLLKSIAALADSQEQTLHPNMSLNTLSMGMSVSCGNILNLFTKHLYDSIIFRTKRQEWCPHAADIHSTKL
jgi:hypothetical protein